MKKFSWDIGYYCNFKCNYCFFSEAGWENLKKAQGEHKPPEVIENAWKNIYDKYGSVYIYITGGEPFLYPDFVEIVYRITKFHKVHITSNLSQKLDEFINKIDFHKVELNSTLHPLYMDFRGFTQQVLKLRSAGFTCSVCYLTHPMQIREMLNYKKYFKKLKIDMTLTVFWGKYDGKEYPQDYSNEEKEYYQYVAKWTPERDNSRTFKKASNSLENEIDLQLYNLKPSISKGKLCKAGCEYASITVDGSVKPCGQLAEPILGNIYKGNVKLFERPIKCKAEYCKSREEDYAEG